MIKLDQLDPKLKKRIKDQIAHEDNARRKIPDAIAKHNEAPALGSAVPRAEKSTSRITVRFTGYRVRPLDPDNFAGGVKDLLDGLRYAGLIPGDEAWRIRLKTDQEQVDHFTEEKTVIEIIYP